jgi:hypothetical protein
MLKMGTPMGAVQNAMKRIGKDPNVINLDPNKQLSSQQQSKAKATQASKITNGPKIFRKQLHWNTIDESKLSENLFWNQAKEQSSLQLVGLDIDNKEFARCLLLLQ